MLVFVTDPTREELELTGTVDVVVARVPASLSPLEVALWVERTLDLFPDDAVWLGEPANHSPTGAFLTFVVMSTLRRRDASDRWVHDVADANAAVA
jgi:hypothetical protein